MCEYYEPIRRNCVSTPEITKKMDACISLTAEICDLVCKRKEIIEEAFNDELEKERVRETLKKYHHSIFGYTNMETVISEASSVHFSTQSKQAEAKAEPSLKLGKAKQKTETSLIHSALSTVSSKRAEAEAELAIKLEKAKAMQKIQAQQTNCAKWKMNGNRGKQKCWHKKNRSRLKCN